MSATRLINSTAVEFSSAGLFHYLMEGYWTRYGDPRVVNYSLIGSMHPILTILAAYSLFVLYLGPWMMRNRKPFSLKLLLMCYNILMSLWNAYFLYRIIFVDFNYGLDMFDLKFPSFDEMSPRLLSKINIGHLYLISKLVDLCDTIFFVLRKKQSQVTWLHFYHHFSVPLFGWIHFRLCGTNAVVVPFGLLNSFTHTLMYAYYGLAAMGPTVQPYLTWKRYLTQIQIGQFIALFVYYTMYFNLFQEGYSNLYVINGIIQSVMYIWLFSRFYFNTYDKSAKKRQEIKSESETAKSSKIF